MVRVELLVSADQAFRCVPYAATMAARSCVERQRVVGVAPSRVPTKASLERAASGLQWQRCADCDLGREVARAIGAKP